MITPTCQVCGQALKLDDGTSIETVVRRGSQDDDEDVEEFWQWSQELQYRFCGEDHMRSWMGTLALPTYEPPAEKEKMSALEAVGEALLPVFFLVFVLVVVIGAAFGFLLLLARVF